MKRIVSALTALVMTCTVFLGVLPVSAEETQSAQPAIENDISIEGMNSFGNLLTDSLEEKVDEQQENNGCNVFSAEVTGNEATVSFETTESCTLLVAVYDEAGQKMLASGSAEVTAEEAEKTVTIETDSMPKYFYLRAFLVNTVTLRPICTVYESPNYTQEMQEFFAKTVDDFDSEKVLNLDEDKTNNFAVYGENTKIIQSDGTVNKVTKYDEQNGKYVIENADSSVTSLSAGDIFALEQPDGNVLIVKVGTIKVSGSTVTISEQDTSMEEVFDYVKIDESQTISNADMDTSNLEEGVTFEGFVDDTAESQTYSSDVTYGSDSAYLPAGPDIQALDISGSFGVTPSFKISEKKFGENAKLSGSVSIGLNLTAKVYVSFSYSYIEIKFEYSLSPSFTFSGKIDEKLGKLPLAPLTFSPAPGLYIEFTPTIVFEANVSFKITACIKGTLGFQLNTDVGMKSLNSKPTIEADASIDGSVFLGLSLEPKIVIIHENVANVSLTAKGGVEITGKLKLASTKPNVKHLCQKCIDGDLYSKMTLQASVDFVKLSYSIKLLEVKMKIGDFYYSFDKNEFGFGTCPYDLTKITATVLDENKKPLKDISIKSPLANGIEYGKTNEDGIAEFYVSKGVYTFLVEYKGVKKSKAVTVKTEPREFLISFSNGGGNGSGGGGGRTWDADDSSISSEPSADDPIIDNPTISAENQRLSLGDAHSGYIDDNGSLYMWGYNEYGQLGNGTTEDSNVPIKIMDNVKDINLGGVHSAAITEDGSLYTWGGNWEGQLGNGTREDSSTPIKIMDNVKAVSLGNEHSAAITEDGNLYMWGSNEFGQLGNGTTTASYTPIKIMDNIKAVSLCSYYLSAAITEDGSLYMWGHNYHGQLGNGTTEDSYTPIKIMDNVKAVSLGADHSAAITEDGSLYMWGWNGDGQLGNGTTTYSYTPIKIMDNVKAVSLGYDHSGAITENGSLYMWGWNAWGQLGNGTEEDSYTPIKIMDNVKAVSLGGGSYSAAITEDGSLYMWGSNSSGQLGNGTTEDSSVPIKIEIPSSNSSVSAQSYSLTPQVSYLSDEPALQTKNFTELLPNETYNFYLLKSLENEPLDSDNLLYAGQGVSDESGILTVSYIPKAEYTNAVIYINGMTRTDISGAKVTVPDILCNGEEQFAQPTVTLGGKTLVFGIDYDIEKAYSAVIPGEYELMISGINDYAGEVSAVYNVYCEHSFSNGKCTICGSLETEKGDVNGDGVTGIADIVALQKYLVKLKTDAAGNADVNGDGVVNVFDDVILRRMILNS